MSDPTPRVKFVPYGVAHEPFLITIDGRQALHEGPRRVGHCINCKALCLGLTLACDPRVYGESMSVREGKRAP